MRLHLLLGFILPCSYVTSEPAWFQICDREQKYQLNSEDCSLGIWTKKPMLVDCVCVNGVWAVSNGLCDDDFQILVGSGDCFDINNDIQSVKLIGNLEDPFSPASYVATPLLDVFVKVPQNGFSPTLESSATIVISINVTNSILQRSDKLVCLQLQDGAADKPVHIWKNYRRESNRFKNLNDVNCEDPLGFNYHVGFGEIFQDDSVSANDQVAQNCAKSCLTPPGKYKFRPKIQPVKPTNTRSSSRNRKNIANTRGRSLSRSISSLSKSEPEVKEKHTESKIVWDDLYSLNRKLSFIGGASLTPEQKKVKMNIFLNRYNMSETNLAFAREAREQTVRMMQSHTNFLLLNQPSAKVTTYEYDYFQLARRIFSSVAPKDLIPEKFVNGMTRMFRQLLWESHDKFAHTEHPNTEQHSRIVQSLDACLVNVSHYPMVFLDKKNFSTHNCVNKSSSTYWNATEDPDNKGTALQIWLSNTTIPPEVIFDVRKYDFVVEMAWKISMFAHYHCSTWFSGRGYDHSEMTSKLMSLFNYKVAKRWLNPQDSLKVYKEIFQKSDFVEMALVADRCVEAARDGSEYQKWLLRPKIPISPGDLPVIKRMKREGKRKEPKLFPLWGNKAACMSAFTDPTEKFHYNAKSDCFISRTLNGLK